MSYKHAETCLSVTFLLLLGISYPCSPKELSYQEQFHLMQYRIEHFDLYNPLLHTFKLDPVIRKAHPQQYDFDVYVDEKNVARYSFFRSESYGYLQEFVYNTSGDIVKTVLYPILVDSLDQNAEICTNHYYYLEGELKVFTDMLNGKFILIDGDDALVYEGILSTADPFNIKKRMVNDYFIPLLH